VRGLHAALGDCLARAGRDADAEREFKAELAAISDSAEALVGLATLYKSQGREGEVHTAMAELVTRTPNPTAETYWTIVHTLRVLGDTPTAREWAARGREKFPQDSRFR
jgi:Tfp pilus assembly protein PilF